MNTVIQTIQQKIVRHQTSLLSRFLLRRVFCSNSGRDRVKNTPKTTTHPPAITKNGSQITISAPVFYTAILSYTVSIYAAVHAVIKLSNQNIARKNAINN